MPFFRKRKPAQVEPPRMYPFEELLKVTKRITELQPQWDADTVTSSANRLDVPETRIWCKLDNGCSVLLRKISYAYRTDKKIEDSWHFYILVQQEYDDGRQPVQIYEASFADGNDLKSVHWQTQIDPDSCQYLHQYIDEIAKPIFEAREAAMKARWAAEKARKEAEERAKERVEQEVRKQFFSD